MITRRHFVSLGAFTLCAGAMGLPKIVMAAGNSDQRFVFIFLRGAMDGLFAVPPYGDPNFASARTELAIPSPGSEGGALKLDGMFGLHPAFTNLYSLYQQQQLAVFHAIASPYRERSHFDAQDLVENGTITPHLRETGWLNAALLNLTQTGKPNGIALGPNVPLVLQGKAEVTSWAPSSLPEPLPDMTTRLNRLYANDPALKQALDAAQSAQEEMRQPHADAKEQTAADGDSEEGKRLKQAFVSYMRAAGKFLNDPNGPRIATVDLSGFDSHAGQTNANGSLVQSYKLLDTGIDVLRQELGAQWNNTAVLIVTEFGRTVAMNGSRGTDHGTATAAFLAGGAVKGGRVIADWPGLSANALYQNRDLYPTADLRSLEMAVLRDHMRISEAALHGDIFPGSDPVKPIDGLFI